MRRNSQGLEYTFHHREVFEILYRGKVDVLHPRKPDYARRRWVGAPAGPLSRTNLGEHCGPKTPLLARGVPSSNPHADVLWRGGCRHSSRHLRPLLFMGTSVLLISQTASSRWMNPHSSPLLPLWPLSKMEMSEHDISSFKLTQFEHEQKSNGSTRTKISPPTVNLRSPS